MIESQNLEWKVSWHDDHLKSVCAFANADGGTLKIGRDDHGAVVGKGARERRRLLEELPNKLRDLLGIVAAVKAREEDGVPYLRIVVERYPVPISYRGATTSAAEAPTSGSEGPRLGPVPARENREALGRGSRIREWRWTISIRLRWPGTGSGRRRPNDLRRTRWTRTPPVWWRSSASRTATT